MSVEAILQAIAALPDEEREGFFRRLEQMYPVPILTPEIKALLDERIAAADANPNEGIPWEVVHAECLKRTAK